MAFVTYCGSIHQVLKAEPAHTKYTPYTKIKHLKAFNFLFVENETLIIDNNQSFVDIFKLIV